MSAPNSKNKMLNPSKSFVPWPTTTTMASPPPQDAAAAMIRVNKSVPAPHQATAGRVTLYEPVLVVTPVYVSQRIRGDTNNNNNKRLMTDTQVQDLVDSMQAMMLTTTPTPNNNDIDNTGTEDDEETKHDEGRYEQTVFSKKAKGTVTVKRSRRLA